MQKKGLFKVASLYIGSMVSIFSATAIYAQNDPIGSSVATINVSTTSTTLNPPTAKNPYAILVVGSGTGQFNASSPISFNTGVGCPTNFAAFVTVVPIGARLDTASNKLAVGFETCVLSTTSTTSNTTVTVYNRSHFKTATQTSSGGYIGTSSGAWTVWSTYWFAGASRIDAGASAEPIISGRYLWVQYCYPPGMPMPASPCPTM